MKDISYRSLYWLEHLVYLTFTILFVYSAFDYCKELFLSVDDFKLWALGWPVGIFFGMWARHAISVFRF